MQQMMFHLERKPGFSQTIMPEGGKTPTAWHPDMDGDVNAPRDQAVQPNEYHFYPSKIAWDTRLRGIYQDTHNDLPPPVDASTS
jgi:hypothetical protein